jgi:hypothetical protein
VASCFTNGIDDEFLAAAAEGTWSAAPVADGRPVLYSGNVGEGQGLYRIVPLGKLCTGAPAERL